MQVCAPVLAVALIRNPAAQAEQSTAEFVSHKVAPEPVPTVGMPLGQVQVFADRSTKETNDEFNQRYTTTRHGFLSKTNQQTETHSHRRWGTDASLRSSARGSADIISSRTGRAVDRGVRFTQGAARAGANCSYAVRAGAGVR